MQPGGHIYYPNQYPAGPNNMNIAAASYGPEHQPVYMIASTQQPGTYPVPTGAAPYGRDAGQNVMYMTYQAAQPMQQQQRTLPVPPQAMMMQLAQPNVYQQQMFAGQPQWPTQPTFANVAQQQQVAYQQQQQHHHQQQQQQQQQQYKKQGPVYTGYNAGTGAGVVPAVESVPKPTTVRQRHKLTFTDPTTGKNIVFGSDEQTVVTTTTITTTTTAATTTDTNTSSTTDTNRAVSPSTNIVAAEFAAKVAATLAPSHHQQQQQQQQQESGDNVIMSKHVISECSVPQHPPGAPQNLLTDNYNNDSNTNSANSQSTTTPVTTQSQPVSLAVVSLPAPGVTSVIDTNSSDMSTSVSSDVSCSATSSVSTVTTTTSTDDVLSACATTTTDVGGTEQTTTTTCKDNKKKKNKKKDLRGNKSTGSDMDAFIDDNSTTSAAEPPQPNVALETEPVAIATETQSPVAIETHEALGSEPQEEPVALETQAPVIETDNQTEAVEVESVAMVTEVVDITAEVSQSTDNATQDVSAVTDTTAPTAVTDTTVVTDTTDTSVCVTDTSVVTSVTDITDTSIATSVTDSSVVTSVTDITDTSIATSVTDSSVVTSVTDITDTSIATSVTATAAATGDDAASESVESVDVVFKEPTGLPPGNKTQQELKYKYAEEQWSPLNPEGKKQYDRSFMIQLQYAQTSLTRPANLPQLPDIILTEGPQRTDITRTRSMELRRGEPNTVDLFTPGFIKSSPSGSSRRPPHVQRSISGNKKQQGMEMGGASGGGRKVISVQLQHDVKLHTTENAWKPVINKKEVDDEEAQTEELYKKVRGILNKLTPQKFKTLIQQVLTLPINTEQRLKGCIDIIFEKAISEPNFSVAYANMAKCMLALTVPRDSDATQTIGFRSLLLNKCQQEFEKDKAEELDIAERQKLIDEATSEDKRKLLVAEQEQAASRAKRRSLGNIRFIGELFKLRMLTETIMHDCLFKLLRSYDEDNLECLCQLLTTIGQDLDNKQAKLQPRVDKYFQQLDILVADRKTSARIRFMLLDTIDLRKNNWVPRREKNNPKTIEQIHKEAQEEAQEKHAAIQRASMEQRGRRTGPGAMMGGRPGPPAAGLVGEDGWTSVSRPPRNVTVDPCRLKLTKREQVDDNIQLGPGGRGLSTWHRGSSGGGGKVTTPEPDIRQPNRYSLLERGASGASDVSESSRRNMVSRAYQGRMSGPAATNATTRTVRTQQQQHDIDARGRREFVSPMSSRSASRESTSRPTTDAATSASVTLGPGAGKEHEEELSDDEIERKTKAIMEEYLHLNDMNEALACVRELNCCKSMHMLVYYALTLNLERSLQARQMTGLLLHELICQKVLTLEQYTTGLQQVLTLADDMVIDIPMIWQYLAELISPMIQLPTTGTSVVPTTTGTVVPLVFLRTACQPLLDCVGGDKAAVVVAIVIKDAVHRLGHHTVAELWQHSQLQWTDFLPVDKVDGFLQATDVLFTVTMKPVTNSERKQSSSDELLDLLSNLNVENEQVIDWIDENVTEINESFIRLLTTAICKPAWKVVAGGCVRPEDIDVGLIKRRVALLQKYVNHRTQFELETLYAVQLIVNDHGHPFGALRIFFDLLYDDEIVSEESFYLWRDKPEIGEQTGRGCATMALDQFFKWLEEDTTPASS